MTILWSTAKSIILYTVVLTEVFYDLSKITQCIMIVIFSGTLTYDIISFHHLLDNLISIRILSLIRMFAEFKQSARCCLDKGSVFGSNPDFFWVGRSGMQKIGSGRATRMPTPGLDYLLKKTNP